MAVAVAALGVILGWPFSVLAFLPVTVCALVRRFKRAFLSGAITSIIALVSEPEYKFNFSLTALKLQPESFC